MADPPKTYFVTDKAVVVAGGGKKKPAKQKQRNIDRKLGATMPDFEASASRPAPALGVGKEDTKPRGARLYERYGLVYDPEAEQNPITQAERDALTDLYTEVTGRDITLEDDTLSALERHNLIMRRAGKRRAIERLRGKDDIPEFASAADALDWMRSQQKKRDAPSGEPGVLDRALGMAGEALRGTPGVGPIATSIGLAGALQDEASAGLPEDGTIGRIVRPVNKAIERASDAIEPLPGIPKPQVTINPFDASGSRLSFAPRTIGENVEGVTKTAGLAAAAGVDATAGLAERGLKKLGEAPVTLYGTGYSAAPGGQPGRIGRDLPSTSRPAPRDRLKSQQITVAEVVDEVAKLGSNPNRIVNVATDLDTNLENADPVINEISAAVQRGERIDVVEGMLEPQGAKEQQKGSPFSADVDASMRAFAKANGWDDSEWALLTPAERLFRGNTKYNPLLIGLRNVVRSVGEAGAVPAAAKAAADATAAMLRGDASQAEQMLTDAIAPFARARATQNKRGIWAALGEFLRDDPVYFALIANSMLRTASRGVGAGLRAAGSERVQPGRIVTAVGEEVRTPPQPRPLPEVPEPRPGQASARERIDAQREAARIDAENRQRQQAYEFAPDEEARIAASDRYTPEYAIGVTTGRAFNDLVMLPLKKKIAERFKIVGRTLAKRDAERYSRRELNAIQGIGLEIAAILEKALATQEGKRIRRPVDEWTKNRAAFNLVWSMETIDGRPVTPGLVADYFKRQQEDLRAEIGGRYPDKPDQDQLKYWEAQEKFFRRLDEVEIDDATMARVRAAAKPLGEANDKIIAAALGISVKEAKRANYIRLYVLDPEFEKRAQLRKRQTNLEPVQLQIAQRKIKRASDALLEYAAESGWGKKGPAASRRRYEQVREELIAELQVARRLADSLGDDELVRVFDDALAKMRVARSEAAARAVGLAQTLDALDELQMTPDQVARLSPEARAAYDDAQAAAAEARRLAEERAGVLDEIGVRRTTTATVTAAERKVAEARQEVESLRGFAKPDAAAIARAEAKLKDAQDRLARVERAQEMKEPLRQAELSRDQKVREAKRIINNGQTVLDEGDLRAALNAAQDLAAVRIRTRKDFEYYTIERARNETIDEFIARVEAQGKNPVLHLVQTRAFQQLGQAVMVTGGRRLRGDTMARVRSGRLQSSEGYTFQRGYEDPSMWRNLLFDTAELQSSVAWSQKITDLLDATSLRWRFNSDTLAKAAEIAKQLAPDESGVSVQSRALGEVINATSVEADILDYVVLPVKAPAARRPSERVDMGALRQMDPESIGGLTVRQLTERDIDPDAPGDYYLVPRGVYDGIMKAVEDEAFRFTPPKSKWNATSGWQYRLDRMTRAWRTVTLNVFPRTAVVNSLGSAMLAVQAGAGPRAMQYAAMAILGIEMRMPDGSMRALPVPPELRQRYYEQQLTNPVVASRMRLNDLPEPDAKDAAFAWAAWYMNTIRYVNGMSEDLGRLAVWYSKAYPEALRNTPDAPRFFLSAKRLTNDAVDLLEAMARGDEAWRVKHRAWMQQSFDFLGDLHKGGGFASRMRIAIPFWQWYWHMLKLTLVTMPLKYPGRALFLQMVGDIGAQYQEEHGVVVPWAWGFIPFMTKSDQVGIERQLVTQGVDSDIYPQLTIGRYTKRDGTPNIGKAIQDSINPIMSNTSLVVWSLLVGEAKEFDDKDVTRTAKDEFGIDIDSRGDSQFWNYVANRAYRMVPLMPSVISTMGRASTAFPFPGQMAEKYKGPNSLERPAEMEARNDLTDLGFDWRPWAAFLSKITVGVRYDEVEGIGPIWREQLRKDAAEFARKKSEQERKLAQIMREAFDGD